MNGGSIKGEVVMDDETTIQGWKAIAKMFQVHPVTMAKKRQELLDAGVIFYLRVRKKGNYHRMVCAFPSNLKAWQIKKSSQCGRI